METTKKKKFIVTATGQYEYSFWTNAANLAEAKKKQKQLSVRSLLGSRLPELVFVNFSDPQTVNVVLKDPKKPEQLNDGHRLTDLTRPSKTLEFGYLQKVNKS